MVNAAYQATQPLALIDATNRGRELAKAQPPLKGRHAGSDFLVQEIFREVIRGAGIFICENDH